MYSTISISLKWCILVILLLVSPVQGYACVHGHLRFSRYGSVRCNCEEHWTGKYCDRRIVTADHYLDARFTAEGETAVHPSSPSSTRVANAAQTPDIMDIVNYRHGHNYIQTYLLEKVNVSFVAISHQPPPPVVPTKINRSAVFLLTNWVDIKTGNGADSSISYLIYRSLLQRTTVFLTIVCEYSTVTTSRSSNPTHEIKTSQKSSHGLLSLHMGITTSTNPYKHSYISFYLSRCRQFNQGTFDRHLKQCRVFVESHTLLALRIYTRYTIILLSYTPYSNALMSKTNVMETFVMLLVDHPSSLYNVNIKHEEKRTCSSFGSQTKVVDTVNTVEALITVFKRSYDTGSAESDYQENDDLLKDILVALSKEEMARFPKSVHTFSEQDLSMNLQKRFSEMKDEELLELKKRRIVTRNPSQRSYNTISRARSSKSIFWSAIKNLRTKFEPRGRLMKFKRFETFQHGDESMRDYSLRNVIIIQIVNKGMETIVIIDFPHRETFVSLGMAMDNGHRFDMSHDIQVTESWRDITPVTEGEDVIKNTLPMIVSGNNCVLARRCTIPRGLSKLRGFYLSDGISVSIRKFYSFFHTLSVEKSFLQTQVMLLIDAKPRISIFSDGIIESNSIALFHYRSSPVIIAQWHQSWQTK